LGEPASAAKVPWSHNVQLVKPAAAEMEPAAQRLQEAAVEAEYIPATQAVQLVELRLFWNRPALHFEQVDIPTALW
jgi:hypothetical protein